MTACYDTQLLDRYQGEVDLTDAYSSWRERRIDEVKADAEKALKTAILGYDVETVMDAITDYTEADLELLFYPVALALAAHLRGDSPSHHMQSILDGLAGFLKNRAAAEFEAKEDAK
jgi:hypothetical protein